MPWFRVRPIPLPERGFELAAQGILGLLRVLAIHFSPNRIEVADGL